MHIDETQGRPKKVLFLRAQKGVIGFADGLETGLKILIVPEPLLNLGDHFGPNTELLGDATGITDGEHPDRVSITAFTFGATLLVANGAMEQRTAQDLRDGREVRSQAQATLESLLLFHHL